MTPNLLFIETFGKVVLPLKLAPFRSVGNLMFDRRLAALKVHCESDGLTACEAIGLLDSWSDVLRDATNQGKQDAFVATLAIGIMQNWISQYEDAIRAQVAA